LLPSNLSSLSKECVTTLLEAANVRIERFVTDGSASPEVFWFRPACAPIGHRWAW
jgi:hypothetical protein